MEKKILVLFFAILLILPLTLAVDLDVKQKSSNEVMILGLNKPAIYDLEIKNNGADDNLQFYTYFTQSLYPKGTTFIGALQTKDVKLEVYPSENQKTTGRQAFDVFIKGNNDPETKKTFIVNVINLDDAFEVGSGELDLETKTIEIYIENTVNFDFENLEVEFSSPFFEIKEKTSLAPNEKKIFVVDLNKKDFEKLSAGFYTLVANIKVQDLTAQTSGVINFKEKNILTETDKNFGLIINTKIITKTNEGNVVEPVQFTVTKNVVSRLFTTFNSEPDSVRRNGFKIYYTWQKDLEPGEQLEIKIKTNWFFPLIIIILIVVIVTLVKMSAKTNLVLRKRVSFVRAKGGEFALKVSIIVRAKKYIEKVSVIDRLPGLVSVHERFGSERPSRIDEKNKKLEWNFEKMEPGETRILSYIIFSKIGLLGQFALPRTTAIFERDGQIKEAQSNRTYFVNEATQNKKDIYRE